jgi:hypothetical protein
VAGQLGGKLDYLFTIDDRETLRNGPPKKQAMCRKVVGLSEEVPVDEAS